MQVNYISVNCILKNWLKKWGMIYIGNRTEWSAIWAESYMWFQTKIARHKVQLPLYYIHSEIAQIQD